MLTKPQEGQRYLRRPENTRRNGTGPKAASVPGPWLRSARKAFSGIPKGSTPKSSLVLRNLLNKIHKGTTD